MDLMQSLRILRRRRILALVLLLLTLVATGAAASTYPRTYAANAATVLLESKDFAKPVGGNPYLDFDSSLTVTADIVSVEVTDPRTGLVLAARGYTASYQVILSQDTSGPVLLITVTGKNKVTVERTLQAVTGEVGTKLAALQATTPPDNQVKNVVISMSPTATLSLSKLARPLVVILGLGLILTFFVPQIVDAQAARRTRRKLTAGRDNEWVTGDSAATDAYSRYGAEVGPDVRTSAAYPADRTGHRIESGPNAPSARSRLR